VIHPPRVSIGVYTGDPGAAAMVRHDLRYTFAIFTLRERAR
jgi:hypothetical protein